MNDALVKAIDDLIAFVDAYVPDQPGIVVECPLIPRAEIDGCFKELDGNVFRLAHRLGLQRMLPDCSDWMEREVHIPNRPLQFKGETHLPGD